MPHKPDRCPVTTHRCYAALRPASYCEHDSSFYVAIKKKQPASDMEWFKRQPIGINNIANFAVSMVKAAELDDGRKLTNTSYRKHLAARLNEGSVPKEVGRHVTGHKQASSLDNYAPLSNRQQRILSDIVGGENINYNIPQTTCASGTS